jgi:hypothetical protein
LTCVSLPLQINAQTQVKQKTELITAKHAFRVEKKKVIGVKIHHPQKKAVKKNRTRKKVVPLHMKEKLVKAILDEHLFALRIESLKTGFSTSILVGVIASESTNIKTAVSPKEAKGLGQTKDVADKATGINCDSFIPACSIKKMGGYLRHLRIVEKIVELPYTLIGYNRGPKGLKKFKGIPENDPYVRNVLSYAILAGKNLKEEPF